jgi:hypothetical protein
VHTRIYTIERLCEYAALRSWRHSSLLRSVVGGHPLEEPGIGFIVAGHLQIDQHASPNECSAMLESLLACTRRDTKRRKTKSLRQS